MSLTPEQNNAICIEFLRPHGTQATYVKIYYLPMQLTTLW